jgi:catechol 2,3-dioxygenase-like lactoylglutathione lyase family enzyme
MEPRLSLITLGVADFARSLAFYRDGLKFPLSSASQDDVAFFRTGGVVLALYPRHKLADDATVSDDGRPGAFAGVVLAHSVREKADVAAVLAQAAAAGGRVVKPAQDVFWGGHSGYFADPDGHLWEVAWNPGFPLADDGRVVLP